MTPSPYLPATRRFANPIYLRVEDIPEAAYLAARDGPGGLAGPPGPGPDASDRVDRDASWGAKGRRSGWCTPSRGRASGRRRTSAYRAAEGPGLDDFAAWSALAEVYGPDVTGWPDELRDPAGPAVAREAAARRRSVDFHRWLQWVVDDQLGAAQRAARDAGMGWASCTTSPSACTRGAPTPGRWGTRWRAGSPSAPRRTSSTSSARTGRSRPGGRTSSPSPGTRRTATCSAPSCGTRAGSGSTTYRALPPVVGADGAPAQRGHVRALRPRGAGRHPGPGGAPRRRGGDRGGPGHRGAVGPRLPARAGDAGHLGAVVREGLTTRRGVPLRPERAAALPGHGDHPRPAADLGLPAGEHIDLRDQLGLLTRTVAEERDEATREQADLIGALRERGLLGADVDDPAAVVAALHPGWRRRPRCCWASRCPTWSVTYGR